MIFFFPLSRVGIKSGVKLIVEKFEVKESQIIKLKARGWKDCWVVKEEHVLLALAEDLDCLQHTHTSEHLLPSAGAVAGAGAGLLTAVPRLPAACCQGSASVWPCSFFFFLLFFCFFVFLFFLIFLLFFSLVGCQSSSV